MHFLRSVLTVLICVAIVFIAACGGSGVNTVNGSQAANPANSNAASSNVPKTNVEELGMIVNVPYAVEDVVWKEFASTKTLVAVLRFSPADSAKVVAEAEKSGPPQPGTISPETWFPDELIAQSEMTGDNVLRGAAYAADGFLQQPYTTGKITRIEGTDYFVLEARAK